MNSRKMSFLNNERAQNLMEKYDLSAIVATTPKNVYYLTGFDSWIYRKYKERELTLTGSVTETKQLYGILPRNDGQPKLVMDTITALYATELNLGGLYCYKDVNFPREELAPDGHGEPSHVAYFRKALAEEKSNPAEALVAALKDANVSRGRVALELANLRSDVKSALKNAFPQVTFPDDPELLNFIRIVKTRDEIENLKKSCETNEKALYESFKLAKEGVKMRDLMREFMAVVGKEGAEYDHYFNSPDGLYLSEAENYRFRRGEYTIIDNGCTYKLYYSDMGTTLVIGKENQQVMETHKKVWDVIDSIAESTGPGVRPSTLGKRLANDLQKLGLKHPDFGGHGIGLNPREFPIIGPEQVTLSDEVIKEHSDVPLEEDMVINIETSLYQFGKGGYEVERTFVVGKNKLEEVTTEKGQYPYVTG
jgi:Xaa-Pro dipeptidase